MFLNKKTIVFQIGKFLKTRRVCEITENKFHIRSHRAILGGVCVEKVCVRGTSGFVPSSHDVIKNYSRKFPQTLLLNTIQIVFF